MEYVGGQEGSTVLPDIPHMPSILTAHIQCQPCGECLVWGGRGVTGDTRHCTRHTSLTLHIGSITSHTPIPPITSGFLPRPPSPHSSGLLTARRDIRRGREIRPITRHERERSVHGHRTSGLEIGGSETHPEIGPGTLRTQNGGERALGAGHSL